MGEVTADQPKGMVEVAGVPLLTHAFRTLLDVGVSELVVIVGYEAGNIIDHFGEEFAGVPIRYVHQRKRNGLASAVQLAEPYIDEQFVVLNGDNVFVDGISHLIDQVIESEADAGVVVEETTLDVARKTGVVQTQGGTVTGLSEKTDDPDSNLITTGCYVLPTEIFDACQEVEASERGEYELSEALDLLLLEGATVSAVRFSGTRLNVNTPEDIESAEQIFSNA